MFSASTFMAPYLQWCYLGQISIIIDAILNKFAFYMVQIQHYKLKINNGTSHSNDAFWDEFYEPNQNL